MRDIIVIQGTKASTHSVFYYSGFGQKDGRVGFRTTFLPQEEELEKAITEFKRHHELFLQKYA